MLFSSFDSQKKKKKKRSYFRHLLSKFNIILSYNNNNK